MPLAPTKINTSAVVLAGGLDLLSSSQMAKQGSAVAAINYEPVFGGGFERAGGIERFSGRPRPSDAQYTTSVPQTNYSGIALGNTVTGLTSGATGVAIYNQDFLALTKVVGTYIGGEEMQVLGVTKGIHTGAGGAITAMLNNTLLALAAANYRADITTVPGSGEIRGIAALGSTVYAWRNNAGATAMVLHKQSATGWTAVALNEYVTFSNANTSVGEGDVLTQGAVTATITRVVVETGALGSGVGVNTGKLTISGRAGGNYGAGAATSTGGGALTLGGIQIAITLLPNGRVLTDRFNFTASLDTLRLYGCDGVNPEFEFDGTVYVPLNTGQTVRAKTVRAHANHLFFGFRGSLQPSGTLAPYQFTAISGASELGAGDEITGLLSLPGSADAASMLVHTKDSTRVLYGNAAAGSQIWRLITISHDAGANAFSVEDCGHAMFHDVPGFRQFKPTQSFGNFTWDLASRLIEPLAKNKTPVCAVFSKALSRYRCFFSDGSAVSGTPGPKGTWEWTQLAYSSTTARVIKIAYSTEVAGVTRTFYGDDLGYVYEADVGRSFDGDVIPSYLKLHGLNQKSPNTDKFYRFLITETIGQSAFLLMSQAEFDDGNANVPLSASFTNQSFGASALYDLSLYDASFYDSGRQDGTRQEHSGDGYNISPIFFSLSAEELSHQLKTVSVYYTVRKVRTG